MKEGISMKRFLVLVMAVMLLVANVAVAFAAGAYDIDTAKKSVVRIVTEFHIDPAYNSQVDPVFANGVITITGSGFAVGDYESDKVQNFVTAAHVTLHNDPVNPSATSFLTPLKDGGQAYVPVVIDSMRVLLGDESSFVNAQFVGRSDRADVAVVATNMPIDARKAAVLLKLEKYETNMPVTAMGFPGASDDNLTVLANYQLLSTTEHVTVNAGTVSRAVTHAETGVGDQIQTTATMSGGISGGPLVDNDGYVVGVCTSGSNNSENVKWASTTNEVIRLLNNLSLKYTVGPVKSGLSTTMIIIIAVAAVVIIALIVLIIVMAGAGKKNVRTLVFAGAMNGHTEVLKKGTSIVIGRDPSKCKVIYPKNTAGVSGVHCTISFDGNTVTVADNGSSFGTFVGGNKVEPGRPVEMHRGQEVMFGADANTAALH